MLTTESRFPLATIYAAAEDQSQVTRAKLQSIVTSITATVASGFTGLAVHLSNERLGTEFPEPTLCA